MKNITTSLTNKHAFKLLITILITSVFFFGAEAKQTASLFEVKDVDKISYYNKNDKVFSLELAFWEKGWKFCQPKKNSESYNKQKNEIIFNGSFNYSKTSVQKNEVPFILALQKTKNNEITVSFEINSAEAVETEGVAIVFNWNDNFLSGKTLTINEQANKIPFYAKETSLLSQKTSLIKINDQQNTVTEIIFDKLTEINLEDRRIHSAKNEFELRVWLKKGRINAGKQKQVIKIQISPETLVLLDTKGETTNNQNKNWIENPLVWDEFPLDLSFLNSKPAGLNGFVTAYGDKFVLSKNKSANLRFFGVNLSADQCFPNKTEAEKLAKRLSKIGINLVRVHHLDAKWATNQLTTTNEKGELEFNPLLWLKLDYLFFCLKQEGIYVQLDLLVDPDELWEKKENVKTWKGFSHFVPELIKRQKIYAHAVWEHRNIYTKLAYKDDPVFALSTITNENDLTTHNVIARKTRYDVEPYISQFETLMDAWKSTQKISPDVVMNLGKIDLWNSATGKRFLNDTQANYFRDISQTIQNLGVKIPLTGTNWCFYQKDLPSLAVLDYLDNHSYGTGRLNTKAELGNFVSSAAFARTGNKPFVVSEYGIKNQDKWRASVPLQIASIGSFQDWNGLILYAYRQRGSGEINYIQGTYDLLIDPMIMAVLPVSALIFRRQDVKVANESYGINWTDDLLYGDEKFSASYTPFYNTGILRHKLFANTNNFALHNKAKNKPQDSFVKNENLLVSDTKELTRDLENEQFTVNTSFNCGVVGNFTKKNSVQLGKAGFFVKNEVAAVFLSSLDNYTIGKSEKLLVTAVGKAENFGTVWNFAEDEVITKGKSPVVSEPVVGTIVFENENKLKAFTLDNKGNKKPKNLKIIGNKVTLNLLESDQTLFYLLEKEK